MNTGEDLTKCTDEELIRLLRNNDKRALIIIFDRYAAGVDSYIYSQIDWSFQNRFANREVRQCFTLSILTEVFVSLWEHHDKLKIKTNLREYLNSVVRRSINRF